MLIEVVHENLYTYDSEVFLEPHLIRLYPRLSPYISVLEETVDILPKPVMTAKNLDAEGSTVIAVWFEGKTTSFQINTKFKLDIKPYNSFGFFADPIDLGFPFKNNDKALVPYLESTEELDSEIISTLNKLENSSENSAINFAISLADYIYKNFEYVIREEGAPYSANETFAQKSGSCRDFAVLFAEAARHCGLPARFVSGYKLNNKEDEYHLHAWAEVFIPGGGWRGVDPSVGLFVDSDYIPLCASFSPENTAPIFGFTRGKIDAAKFEYKIEIKDLGK